MTSSARIHDPAGGHGAAAIVFLVCALILALPWISGAVTIPFDAKAHFQPQFVFLAHALHTGQSPFWTPYVFAGSPHVADPQSLIFSPFFLIAAWFSPEPSFRLEDSLVFAMLAMGGLAVIAFFRDRGWHASGALAAALAFAFGGSAAWRIQHTGEAMSLSWFPVTLWLLARALEKRSVAWGAAAGVVAAFLVLGRDQVAFLEVLVLAAYAIYRVASDDRKIVTAVAPLLAGLVCGLAIAALPLAFTLELARQSNRPAIDLAGALQGSLHPASFLTLISANLYGTAGPLRDFWGPPSPAFGTSDIFLARNMGDVYMGALPALALLAALRRGFPANRDIWFFVVAAAALALYALGRFTPVFQFMFAFPGVDLFRRPADATFPLCAILAIIAGYSLHLVATGRAKLRFDVVAGAVAAALAIAASVAFAKDRLAVAVPPMLQSAGFAALAFVILALARRMESRGFLLLPVVGAAMTVDLAVGNAPNESTAAPPAQFDVLRTDSRNDTIALLRERLAATAAPDRRDRIELAGVGFHWPNASLVHGLDHDLGYNPIRLKLFQDATGAGDHVALPEQRVFSPLFSSYRSTMADLLGLRFIATGVPIEAIDKHLQPGDVDFLVRTKDAYVYENKRALPRVLLATCARRADFAKMAEDGVWPDVDYRATVLLEEAPTCDGAAGGRAAAGHARIASYRNTDILIEAEAPRGGGYVALNDVWHPWWIAEVDGRPAPLLRANVMFRAVPVPAGRHDVRFLFRPLQGLLKGFVGE
ncbi:MAG: glycosyltransferase family 39 protein [Methylocystis sp.]|nr:glycosyltransferase family 39 protein [Methylocystis sp.]